MSNSGSGSTKNDLAWGQLFNKYPILEHIDRTGYFEITAKQINEFREARLMTKFDHSINLPKLFSDNQLAILPITRGSYILSRFAAYQKFEQLDDEVTRAAFPENIESIDYENITSEAMAINCAFVSGILADFLEETELMPTVSGRMSSDRFAFTILNTDSNSNVQVNVANSQLEIDGGYEGSRQIALIEAKNYISDDFLIRQLYYPYRLWSSKVAKQVTPVFLVYTNGIFSLYEYKFQEPENYNSLVLVKQRNYSINAVEISLDEITAVMSQARCIKEPEVSFPQANSFERVINLCELLLQGDLTRDEITENYAFDPRQTSYYTDAGRYLGLICKHKEHGEVAYSLTQEGRAVVRSKYKSRQLRFVEAILKHDVFARTLKLYLQRGEKPTKHEIVEIMMKCNLYQVGAESTYIRRSSTVASWIDWILSLQR